MELAAILSPKHNPQNSSSCRFDSEETESLTFLFSQANLHEKEENSAKYEEPALPKILSPKHSYIRHKIDTLEHLQPAVHKKRNTLSTLHLSRKSVRCC